MLRSWVDEEEKAAKLKFSQLVTIRQNKIFSFEKNTNKILEEAFQNLDMIDRFLSEQASHQKLNLGLILEEKVEGLNYELNKMIFEIRDKIKEFKISVEKKVEVDLLGIKTNFNFTLKKILKEFFSIKENISSKATENISSTNFSLEESSNLSSNNDSVSILEKNKIALESELKLEDQKSFDNISDFIFLKSKEKRKNFSAVELPSNKKYFTNIKEKNNKEKNDNNSFGSFLSENVFKHYLTNHKKKSSKRTALHKSKPKFLSYKGSKTQISNPSKKRLLKKKTKKNLEKIIGNPILDFSYQKMDNDAAKELIYKINIINKELRRINLEGNEITDKTAFALTLNFSDRFAIDCINLSHNFLSEDYLMWIVNGTVNPMEIILRSSGINPNSDEVKKLVDVLEERGFEIVL